MNIKFGMDNFYTRYLKRFLNHHLTRSTGVLGEFKREDLNALIKYLNLPNTATVFEVKKQLLTATEEIIVIDEETGEEKTEVVPMFPNLDEQFIITTGNDELTFLAKEIDTTIAKYIQDYIEEIRVFCKKLGWTVGDISSWVDTNYDVNNDGIINEVDKRVLEDIIYQNMVYDESIMKKADVNLDGVIDEEDIKVLGNYIKENRVYFTLKSEGRKNIFPNKDMLIFINQFDGVFLDNYAIRDDNGYTDRIHPHEPDAETGLGFKIALYKCQPGQQVTIAHDCKTKAHLVIGCANDVIRQNITSNGTTLTDVVEIDLEPGQGYEYTTTVADGETVLNSQWLCIQCPSDYSNISNRATKKIYLEVGDINFDGRIDMEDYNILAQYTAEGDGAENLPWNKANWTPTDKQLAVMNCRIDNEWHMERINTDDAVMLYNYINNIGGITDLGLTPWTIDSIKTSDEIQNVSNILIIDGHFDSSYNIPYSEFTKDPWIIHDKFFNYLFGMAVHKYSNSEDITYVQKLLNEISPENKISNDFILGIYDENMRTKMKLYQSSKMNYTTGDLNKDNKLDKKDLALLGQFIEDCVDYTRVCKYLSDPITYPLTKEEQIELDRDGDRSITEVDKRFIESELNQTYSPLLRTRSDINGDGFIDEKDYNDLKKIIENGSTYIEKKKLKPDGTYETKLEYCDLKNRYIPFQLGWLDVQTESILEFDVNNMGFISEVTK